MPKPTANLRFSRLALFLLLEKGYNSSHELLLGTFRSRRSGEPFDTALAAQPAARGISGLVLAGSSSVVFMDAHYEPLPRLAASAAAAGLPACLPAACLKPPAEVSQHLVLAGLQPSTAVLCRPPCSMPEDGGEAGGENGGVSDGATAGLEALLGSEQWQWEAIPNLDQFFTRIYRLDGMAADSSSSKAAPTAPLAGTRAESSVEHEPSALVCSPETPVFPLAPRPRLAAGTGRRRGLRSC